MKIPAFKLEEFWRKYEFTSPYLLCCSDAETWSLEELLSLADSDSLKLWKSLAFGYTEAPGHPLLRKEIANLYDSLNSEQIFTFAGAEEGIYCTMRVLVEPGDHVITIDPCYQSLTSLPEAFGATITKVQLKPENHWKLDLEEVRKAFRSNTKLLILNYPHNPTGTLLEKKVLEGLISLARKHGTYIFCDEVYRYLEIDETLRMPSIADAYEKGIALNVMTKSFGFAGLRIGWLATQDDAFLHEAGSYKLYTSICNSAPSEILAIMALRAKEKVLQRNRDILLKNLHILEAFIKRNQEYVSWIRPQSGTMAILKLLLPVSVEDFTQDLVRSEGVLIMPGSVFDLPGNFFRIGFGKKNMPEILQRFETYLQAQGHHYAASRKPSH
ncbi:MAG: aminotransferase class I/II-fold pyridoxal phosphate-dependent enzyme [Verrucomicrobia bacterium]|nr:aminotransferase class I/II-fold pyridoxal phosphate-dependent enzyme [Verrucomicrobiota bacterium]MBU6445802.1 aminotransferase class I/II-fold pyridoxal phosphate-dependent enzyme [Verrucomicrobiota bacterium]MDE3046905.1 aminotransferase class I/II-fold pyridoxal phosphate-dependent enzyme [Verrucomicrobiota bacterium]